MNIGKFITIEGSEGAGKSTALNFVRDFFAPQFATIATREPGGTEIAEAIRQVLLHPTSIEPILPETELLLMFAARAQQIERCIQPKLQQGVWVICDRFIDASYAYQGAGRGLNPAWIKFLDDMVAKHTQPDVTLLLDIPVKLGFERTAKRGFAKDRIESERMEFFERVREGYLQRAAEFPHRIKVIDASQPIEMVQQQIASVLNQFLREQQQ
jgi:dTMP kinase